MYIELVKDSVCLCNLFVVASLAGLSSIGRQRRGREAGEGVRTTARSSPTAAGAYAGARQDAGGARGRPDPRDIGILRPRFLRYAIESRDSQ
jgi:hypothetical protein